MNKIALIFFWVFDAILGLIIYTLTFLTKPFLLILHNILDTAYWKQPMYFIILHCRLSSSKSLTILSIVSIDSSSVGTLFPFNLLRPTAC